MRWRVLTSSAGVLTLPREQAKARHASKPRWRALAALWTAVASGALLAAIAPAASGSAPRGDDFEQDLPAVERIAERATDGHAGEGPVTHRSPAIDAPRAFDLAGLSGEMRAYELRGRVSGGEWTDWTETANGDPVWFGGMDQLQVRTRGFRPRGAVHYVGVSGTASVGGATRGAGGDIPELVTRRQWGANKNEGGCKPRKRAEYGKVKAASVHHTVSAVDYAESQAPGMVLGDLPLPPKLERLERHRLQRARRPVRKHLRGSGRRAGRAGDRGSRPGLQRPDDGSGRAREPIRARRSRRRP